MNGVLDDPGLIPNEMCVSREVLQLSH